MQKYFIDFEFAGHVEVKARNEKDAKKIVENTAIKKLLPHVQSFNVGKNYIDKRR